MQCQKPVHLLLQEGRNLSVSIGAVRSEDAEISISYLASTNKGLQTDYRPLTINGEEIKLSKSRPQVLLQLPGDYMFHAVTREKPEIFIIEFNGPVGRGGYL